MPNCGATCARSIEDMEAGCCGSIIASLEDRWPRDASLHARLHQRDLFEEAWRRLADLCG